MAGLGHVAGETGPDEGDDGAVAVGGVDAGAADLHQVVPDGGEPGEVELALGVEASGDGGPLGRQEPVGADDLAGGLLPYEEVVAVRVEGVGVEAGLGAVEPGPSSPAKTWWRSRWAARTSSWWRARPTAYRGVGCSARARARGCAGTASVCVGADMAGASGRKGRGGAGAGAARAVARLLAPSLLP